MIDKQILSMILSKEIYLANLLAREEQQSSRSGLSS